MKIATQRFQGQKDANVSLHGFLYMKMMKITQKAPEAFDAGRNGQTIIFQRCPTSMLASRFTFQWITVFQQPQNPHQWSHGQTLHDY